MEIVQLRHFIKFQNSVWLKWFCYCRVCVADDTYIMASSGRSRHTRGDGSAETGLRAAPSTPQAQRPTTRWACGVRHTRTKMLLSSRRYVPCTSPPLVVDRANASSTRWGCQRQSLVLDAKREYMTKMVSSTRGGDNCASLTGGVNDKGGSNTSQMFLLRWQ